MTIRLLLAEDHHVVREGLRALLETEGDFTVVGEAGAGDEVLPRVGSLRPDVVVLDLMLPGVRGLEVIKELSRRSHAPKIVVLSMHASEAYVLEALRAGASAYVLKQSEGAELVRAIREVVDGRRYLSPPLSERAVEAYALREGGGPADPYQRLTSRERQVLQLVAEGLTAGEIASRLFISPRTVETHRANLMKKLGLRSRAEVIRYAIGRGLVPTDE